MLSALKSKPMKGFLLRPVTARNMSGAATIKDRFQEAWLESNKGRAKKVVQAPQNKAEYGSGYYQRHHKGLKKGYTHPYHSKQHPMSFGSPVHYFETLSNLMGPEQVSPHYESLSRSRRGVFFFAAYVGTIVSISKLGGWSHNEWIRGMIFHHEFLAALYIGYAEIRHFAWLPGPKFTVFYDVFSRYEARQLASHWNDSAEEASTQFYQFSKNQVDYMAIHAEYKFVKKRALVNYLTNERLNLEKHFHERTVSMLNAITSYELQNLKNKLSSITQAAYDATLKRLEEESDEIKEQSFESALDGIRKGRMDFSQDPVLPIMQEELENRTRELKDLSPEEESALLSLTSDQKRLVAQGDRGTKDAYLSAIPHLTSQGLKSHKKFGKFVEYLTNINKKDLA